MYKKILISIIPCVWILSSIRKILVSKVVIPRHKPELSLSMNIQESMELGFRCRWYCFMKLIYKNCNMMSKQCTTLLEQKSAMIYCLTTPLNIRGSSLYWIGDWPPVGWEGLIFRTLWLVLGIDYDGTIQEEVDQNNGTSFKLPSLMLRRTLTSRDTYSCTNRGRQLIIWSLSLHCQ